RAWPRGAPSAWTETWATPAAAVESYRAAAGRASKPSRGRAAPESKTGVWTGAYATNPATGQLIPVFVADYVLMTYGTGAVMGVPGQDERDRGFAEQLSLPIAPTAHPPGVQIVEWLERSGHGRATVTYRLRDWLFSRQRYWGEPFPIVYDEHDLPIALP